MSIDEPEGAVRIGRRLPGYSVPVVDERAVRAAAGLLLLPGAVAFAVAAATGSPAALQPFGALFLLDMVARVMLGERWSPSLVLGALIVRRQRPEWVGAPQKVVAWWLGLGLAATSCASVGVLGAPLWLSLALCGLCLVLLYVETAFGVCVGCALQRIATRTQPQHCPGDSCEYP